MKIVKVLFLDDAPWFLPDLTSHGIELEGIQEGPWGTTNIYTFPTQVCKAVKKLTAGKVDIVVIGNNMGAGVAKAQAVVDKMKEMTIVVWNSYHKGDEQPYTDLGLKHFGSRKDLPQLITEMLGIAT